jgi:transcriptional regulator with XRE-family HTH domain
MMYSLTNLPSSETIEESSVPAEYDAGMELNARIFKARSDAKLTQEELAKAVGKTRSAVAQWESGEVRPRHSTLIAIAHATNKSLLWLMHGGDDSSDRPKIGLSLVGEVAAGTWREGNIHFQKETLPVAPHPDYPPWAQRLYRVSGHSINRVAEHGEYLHTVSVKEAEIKPEHGDLVIVRRTQHGLAEYTAKQLVWRDGEWWLRPESYEPEWQEDIRVQGDESVEIEIVDVVIAKWSPISRRRPITTPSLEPFR